MSDRGAYRSTYTVLLDDPDFLLLPSDVRHLLLTMKFSRINNMAGIFICGAGEIQTLAKQCGYTVKAIRRGIYTLSKGDWVQVEGELLWIRNQLRFDPNIKLNNPKHVKGVDNVLKSLPKAQIVLRFCDYYELAYPFDTHSIPPRITETETEEETETEIEKETDVKSPKEPASLKSDEVRPDLSLPLDEQLRGSLNEIRPKLEKLRQRHRFDPLWFHQEVQKCVDWVSKNEDDLKTEIAKHPRKAWSPYRRVVNWVTSQYCQPKYEPEYLEAMGRPAQGSKPEGQLTAAEEEAHYAAKRRTGGGMSSLNEALGSMGITPPEEVPHG